MVEPDEVPHERHSVQGRDGPNMGTNIAISVQVQLELDLPTGTELGNNKINTKLIS